MPSRPSPAATAAAAPLLRLQPDPCFESALQAELPTMHRLARWFAKDGDQAEDLVQDTFVLALRFRDSFQPGTNLRAWLTRVMRNRHISVLRRRKLERRILDAEGHHFLRDWSIGAMGRRSTGYGGDVERDGGLCDTVTRAIDGLRPEFRQAVELCDLEGMSYAEAARRARCPVGTIMSRLHRGRRALRSALVSRERIDQAA
jgi:RNA polymerase sigma-70 factor (ECF subfamily)